MKTNETPGLITLQDDLSQDSRLQETPVSASPKPDIFAAQFQIGDVIDSLVLFQRLLVVADDEQSPAVTEALQTVCQFLSGVIQRCEVLNQQLSQFSLLAQL